jgi:hypothetical protein
MAKNWLFIENGVVKQIVTQEATPTPAQATGTYDTLAQDDSETFAIGDTFTAELQLQYNKTIWTSYGWIPTDEQIAAAAQRMAELGITNPVSNTP